MTIIKALLASFFAVSVCIAQISVTISGKVTDSGGVTPIPGAAVQLEKGGLPTTSGSDGSFTITGTIVGIITPHFNKTLSGKIAASLHNGYMSLSLREKAEVEISSYTIQGKKLSSLHKTLAIGSHSVALPITAVGVCFYRIRAGNEEFVLKSNSLTGVSRGVNPVDGSVSVTKDKTYIDVVMPDTPDGVKTCWTWGAEKVIREKHLLIAEKSGQEWRIYRKDYLVKDNGGLATTLLKSMWIDKEINNDYGRKVIKELFGSSVMDFPKAIDLIKKLASAGTAHGDVILDFFSGSATTAHAVMQLNAEDGGNRKFIMVQLPEQTDESSEAYKAGYKTIADIGKERIRRAGARIMNDKLSMVNEEKKKANEKTPSLFENENNSQLTIHNSPLDIGFRVYKVDSSNMKDVFYHPTELQQTALRSLTSNIKEDRTPEDLLTQVLLDLGLELSLPIEKKKIHGNTIFIVQTNALVACFDNDINFKIMDEIANLQPLKVVFKDASFKDDKDRINVEERFKRLSPETRITVL